jgi:hypothetical protein
VYHNGISNNAIGMCSEPWYQAWRRSQRWWNKDNQWNWWYYWTADSNGDFLYDGVWIFELNASHSVADTYDGADYRNEFYVRCFKD